jgi:peptidyl-prolyl cis-trans isomerase D
MLQQIRDKITGWVAGVFIGVIAIVFIFWGIQFEGAGSTSAAQVNGESIPVPLVRRAWQNRLSELQRTTRDELPAELVASEQKLLLEQFIRREVLLQHAAELGYRVSDEQLARALQEIPALQVDGRFSRDRYAALLQQQGRSEAEFEDEFRRDLELSQLRNGMLISTFVTPSELSRRVALEDESREVDFLLLPASRFAAEVSVPPERVAGYYEEHKAEFMTEETVALQYLELRLADIASEVEVTDQELREYYEQIAQERFVAPERRRASHILIESGDDDAAAQAQAEDLLKQLQQGADFAALARENSDDPGSKEQGGDLGWATRESYVAPFADALFDPSLKPGELRGPVRTQFGYHLIRLEEVEDAHQRSFDEVRDELEIDFRNDRAQAIFYERSQELADEAFSALTELETVAQKTGLDLRTAERFTRNGGDPFGSERKVIEAAFSRDVLDDRQNSPALSLGDDRVVVLRVTDHQLPEQRSLDSVRGAIEAELGMQAALEAAEAEGRALVARLDQGESLAEVAESLGLETGGRTSVRRSAALPPELVSGIFAAPRPADGARSTGVATLASDDVAVFAVYAVRPGALDAPEQLAMLGERARRASAVAAASEFDAYLGELERTAEIKTNPKLWE